MPDTQELLDQLAESEWFTSIDLSSAFWQLPLAEESRDCTAIMTKTHGLLHWKALPMGFKNSSAYFQRAIEAALGGLRFTCCVAYIDDVVVHSKGSFEDHVAEVQSGAESVTCRRILWQPGEVQVRSTRSLLPGSQSGGRQSVCA